MKENQFSDKKNLFRNTIYFYFYFTIFVMNRIYLYFDFANDIIWNKWIKQYVHDKHTSL